MFGNPNYLEDNSFSTGHQSVNVYGLPEKQYEIRSEEAAVDIQIHQVADRQNQKRPLRRAKYQTIHRRGREGIKQTGYTRALQSKR
jgi:hypothetical protein